MHSQRIFPGLLIVTVIKGRFFGSIPWASGGLSERTLRIQRSHIDVAQLQRTSLVGASWWTKNRHGKSILQNTHSFNKWYIYIYPLDSRLFYYFLIQSLGPSPICWSILGWWKLFTFLQGCGIHGWPLWWCATTMLTFAGWATPRILRRWCQTVVAKRCVTQRSFVLDSLVDDICLVSQNDGQLYLDWKLPW